MFEQFPELSDFQLIQIGDARVTLGSVLGALMLTLAFMIAAWAVGHALKRLRQRTREGNAALYLTEKLLSYGLVIVGVIAGLSTLGLDLSTLTVFAGAIGIGLGLGLQGIVKEFVSGLVLISDRAVHIGDYVELPEGTRGVVQEIGPRATRIRNNDNVYLLVPNSKLIENTMINWTLRGDTRRIHVPFVVAYGADKEKVRDAVLAAARDVPFTMPDTDMRRTQVWMTGFGESALNFELVVWPSLEAVKRPKAMNAAYTWAIDDALRKACIEIPYPQREIRVRGLFGHEGEDALRTLRLEHGEAPEEAPAETTTNDAADDLMRPPPEPEPEELEEEPQRAGRKS
ncbi:MAG TPA: mechanosensitive ion channel domain-containing protein [Vitreimonas sp.]|uniref:mechanosensitive ion channel family protein n=1 Tax=Vitreimonas sp. TaxID=3069702 RepID=UPI002D423AB9|nr:mechanosensitive ion channel domain-containing protein [Vitreimonas sp.]HYD88162.1 mechanosensitive ion channel domain-containing protein [Vitreimonas sp.]